MKQLVLYAAAYEYQDQKGPHSVTAPGPAFACASCSEFLHHWRPQNRAASVLIGEMYEFFSLVGPIGTMNLPIKSMIPVFVLPIAKKRIFLNARRLEA